MKVQNETQHSFYGFPKFRYYRGHAQNEADINWVKHGLHCAGNENHIRDSNLLNGAWLPRLNPFRLSVALLAPSSP